MKELLWFRIWSAGQYWKGSPCVRSGINAGKEGERNDEKKGKC